MLRPSVDNLSPGRRTHASADVAPGERTRNIVRTLTVVACGVAVYYLINGSLQLIAHEIAQHVAPGKVPKNWTLVVNDRVKDLFGGHAPGEERGDAPKRGLLGLDLREMRISSGAIR